MFLTLLGILVCWTLVSFIALVIAWYWMKRSHRGTANHLPPLPHNSILGKHSGRVT